MILRWHDHLGLRGINTVEDLAKVKRVVVEIAKNTAVLNADDPLCLQMADYTQAEHLCYVTLRPTHALVREHIRANGRAVVLEEGMNGHMITIYDNGHHIPLLWTHLIPATIEGRAMHNVQNAMFAAALAFSQGISLENIRHGLRTFDTSFFQAPGRMNLFNEHPFKVILDYAHNPAAVKAVCDTVDRFDVKGRKIVVLAAPGDRRDEDIMEIGHISAGHFDHYICRRDDGLRGRDGDEIPGMLSKALQEKDVDKSDITIIADEQEAVDAALRMAEEGDLVLTLGDAIQRCWKQIIYFSPEQKTVERTEPVKKVKPPEDLPFFELDSDVELIIDERGVRIAREADD